MEYVEGEPLTDYADRMPLGVNARVRLLVQVCDAAGMRTATSWSTEI